MIGRYSRIMCAVMEDVGVGKRGERKFFDYLAIAEVFLREAAEAAGEAELAA